MRPHFAGNAGALARNERKAIIGMKLEIFKRAHSRLQRDAGEASAFPVLS
jgi:hypothetical protein